MNPTDLANQITDYMGDNYTIYHIKDNLYKVRRIFNGRSEKYFVKIQVSPSGEAYEDPLLDYYQKDSTLVITFPDQLARVIRNLDCSKVRFTKFGKQVNFSSLLTLAIIKSWKSNKYEGSNVQDLKALKINN